VEFFLWLRQQVPQPLTDEQIAAAVRAGSVAQAGAGPASGAPGEQEGEAR
jgi:hypothetical protein